MSVSINRRVPIHEGRVFRLFRENVTLENGTTVDLDVIRHPGAAAMVPLINPDTVVMIHQYRHAVGGFLWEIPAGTLDPGETPLQCARRELTEETGFSAAAWRKMGEIIPLPGYSDERIHIFLATDLAPAQQDLDPDEVLRVHWIPLDEALGMIRDGRIRDGKTICSLLMTEQWFKSGGA